MCDHVHTNTHKCTYNKKIDHSTCYFHIRVTPLILHKRAHLPIELPSRNCRFQSYSSLNFQSEIDPFWVNMAATWKDTLALVHFFILKFQFSVWDISIVQTKPNCAILLIHPSPHCFYFLCCCMFDQFALVLPDICVIYNIQWIQLNQWEHYIKYSLLSYIYKEFFMSFHSYYVAESEGIMSLQYLFRPNTMAKNVSILKQLYICLP